MPILAFSGSLVSSLCDEVFVPGKRHDSLRSLRITLDREVRMHKFVANSFGSSHPRSIDHPVVVVNIHRAPACFS